MEWFKHYTRSHEDPDISDAWDEMGISAVAIFWIVLEIYAVEFNHLNGDGYMCLSASYLQRHLRLRRSIWHPTLIFYDSRGRILFREDGNKIFIKIPKFLETSSNWTRRTKIMTLEAPTESPLESPTEEPQKISSVEVEEKRREEKRNKEMLEGLFLKFWDAYPKKKSKDDARKAFFSPKLKMNESLLEIIIEDIEKQKTSDDWIKEDGQFIPYPASYLRGKRWQDEAQTQENGWARLAKEVGQI